MTRLALLLVAGLVLTARPAAASLVVVVPFDHGIAVASDRRATFADGSTVDGFPKVHRAPGRAVFALTGGFDAAWAPAEVPYSQAEWSRRTAPLFVFHDAIGGMIPASVGPDSVPDIARRAAAALETRMPGIGRQHVGEVISRIDVFQPEWFASVTIQSDEHGALSTTPPELHDCRPDQPVSVTAFGQSDYFAALVNAHRLPEDVMQFMSNPKLGRDVPAATAQHMASSIIRAATAAAAGDMPARWGIGGGVEMFSITSAGVARIRTE